MKLLLETGYKGQWFDKRTNQTSNYTDYSQILRKIHSLGQNSFNKHFSKKSKTFIEKVKLNLNFHIQQQDKELKNHLQLLKYAAK